MINKKKLSYEIKKINSLTEEDKRYLYGECDKWVLSNYEKGLEIVSLMEKDNYENGILHCYLRNPKTGCCYDVRGESGTDEEIILYTGVEYNNKLVEFVFNNIFDYKMYLCWLEFEIKKEQFIK